MIIFFKTLYSDLSQLIRNDLTPFPKSILFLKIYHILFVISEIGSVAQKEMTYAEIIALLRKEIDDADDKFNDEVKDLHSRLTTNSREIESKMSNEIDKVLDAIKDLKSHMVNKHDALEERLVALERWRWILIGAIMVGGLLLGNGYTLSNMF